MKCFVDLDCVGVCVFYYFFIVYGFFVREGIWW